ncbi:hypothetical protein [Sagittula sp. S175]|uniref:hypothetical protein n=1 Tax=Sagittula sp. S175 TaxID=3415129 RepID=UPI003C7B10BC
MIRPALALAALTLTTACLPPETVSEIPTALQGRWALVPADCEPGRSDAKGLMIVGPHSLGFYESRAVLDRLSQRSEDRVQGSFIFTGEGESWTRLVTLSLSDASLTRRETAPDAAPLALTYSRCP